jgi:chaperone protein EcpD
MSALRSPGLLLAALAATACLSQTPLACAGIIIDTTRVVYPAARREVTVSIRNNSETPSLVQAWLDAGDPKSRPDESAVPFVLTPPLFRLDPTRSQSLRLVYTQEPLPTDRESVFWLNVMDIPPRAAANPERPNQLEMAFKHRMKVFFRPAGLKGSAADAPAQLSWKLATEQGRLSAIQVHNPTAFHVSLVRTTAMVDGKPVSFKTDMVAPFASARFDVEAPVNAPGAPLVVEYTFVNDYGGNVKATASASAP